MLRTRGRFAGCFRCGALFLQAKYNVFVILLQVRKTNFYSASALLSMQSAVLARGILSVRMSVCPSVTFRYCVQTNEDTIVRFSASVRSIPLVFWRGKFYPDIRRGSPQAGALK